MAQNTYHGNKNTELKTCAESLRFLRAQAGSAVRFGWREEPRRWCLSRGEAVTGAEGGEERLARQSRGCHSVTCGAGSPGERPGETGVCL